MKHKDVFIGVCYHKNSPAIRSQCFTPIHVGAALSSERLEFAVRDDTGDSISERNPNWCELTGLYWMWKNVDAEHYGLMHYRRLLNFNQRASGRTKVFEEISEREIFKFGWDDTTVRHACSSADILTAPIYPVHPVEAPDSIMTNYEFYEWEHYAKDLDVVEKIVAELSPHIRPFFIKMLNSKTAFFGNVTVMKKALFHEYCEWLFQVLFEAEKRIDISGYDAYQKRIWGFLAERMTVAFVDYAMTVRGASRRTLPLVFRPIPPAKIDAKSQLAGAAAAISSPNKVGQRGGGEIINILMAVDSAYVPHAAATIHSALTRASEPQSFCFHFLDNGSLTEDDITNLQALVVQFGAELRVVNIDDDSLRWLPLNRAHISLQTYYRLLAAEVLPDVQKVVYLDADIIVTADLKELWDHPMEGSPIAAAPDEGGRLQARRLQLPLTHDYFNAGVCVLDLDALRSVNLHEGVLLACRKFGELITLQDQDLLNIIFAEKTQKLPLEWNVNTRIYNGNLLEPAYTEQEAQAAANHPKIIHFTDRHKPWDVKCLHPLAPLYWLHRNQTVWRETRYQSVQRHVLGWVRSWAVAKNRKARQR
ncbi:MULTISPECIES: DUF4422 domain-containing protein [unclassified Ruegeria]|uniref:DUF4422 domain-containing protein n=1 Tax=unclassified Ruegeria TaxID=2625375 RepID=UPI00148880FD|nr:MULTISPECIES: DUF4422 domain-containing protein [unclassified Ruegeria]